MANDSKNFSEGLFIREIQGTHGNMFSMGFNKAKFIAWLQALPENNDGFSNATMKQSKGGKWYVEEDTFVPTRKPNLVGHTASGESVTIQTDDIPF